MPYSLEKLQAIDNNLDQIMGRFGRLYDVSRELLNPEGTSDLPTWEDIPERVRILWLQLLNEYVAPQRLGAAIGGMRAALAQATQADERKE